MNSRDYLGDVRVFGLDIDGVLTDGTYVLVAGKQRRAFHHHDNVGLILLALAGIKTVVITAKPVDRALAERFRELKIAAVYDVCANKVEAMASFLKENRFAWAQACYMGDDLLDVQLLRKVGFAFAPADGVGEVRKAANMVCGLPGGRGAVREAAEYLLKESGKWEKTFDLYLRGGAGSSSSPR